MYRPISFFETHIIDENLKDQKDHQSKIEPALNNIFQAVLSKLKYQPKRAEPKIPKPTADDKMNQQNTTRVSSGGRTKPRRISQRTLPQLKADIDMHVKKNKPTEGMSFQNHQRYREVLRQKRILENMLQEHEKLQSDRNSIVNEINYMRAYLDSIRNRLDVSLKKLNMQKNLCGAPCQSKMRKNTIRKKPSKTFSIASSLRDAQPSKHSRMTGGGQPSTIKKALPVTRKTPYSKETVKNASAAKKRMEQKWVYCFKIDRKNEIKSLI